MTLLVSPSSPTSLLMKRYGFAAVAALVLSLFCLSAHAQALKIGYVNAEVVLSRMPDADSVRKQVGKLENTYRTSLEPYEKYLQQKLAEYQQKGAAGAPEAELNAMRDKLMELQKELQTKTQDAEEQLMAKSQELMKPVLDKLENTINTAAKAEGYTYVFNSHISGTSIMLYAPKEHNLTLRIVDKLGIKLTEEERKALTE